MKFLSLLATSFCLATSLLTNQKEEWSYSEGGADWEYDFEICGIGKDQSPINLPLDPKEGGGGQMREKKHMEWSASYKSFHKEPFYRVGHPVHTYELKNEAGSLTFKNAHHNSQDYRLKQFTVHVPSEHKFNEKRRDAEVHFVNYGLDQEGNQDLSKVLILALTFEESEEVQSSSIGTQFLHSLKINSLLEKTHITFKQMPFFISQLQKQNFYTYEGSFTSPPCEEKVTWIIPKEAIKVKKGTLKDFREVFQGRDYLNGNARNTQPLHDRTIYIKSQALSGIIVGVLTVLGVFAQELF